MILAVPAIARTPAPPVAIIPNPAPDPITSITLSGGVIDWSSYVAPADFAGYDIRYTTVAGQAWAAATDLAPGLQIQNTIAVSAFPAGAVECLVAPVDTAGQYGFPAARQALVVATPPPAITQIALQSDRVAWTYTPPSDFSGYDVRYSTTLGQAWASAPKLYPALRTAAQNFALLSDFPAAAVECLVAPVNTGGGVGLPEARQGNIHPAPSPYALGPDYTVAWTGQPGDAVPVVTQEAASIVVDCGTNDASATANWTAWGKQALPAGRDWTFKIRFTQLDTRTATTTNGIYVQIQTITGGQNGSDANPNSWTTAQYQDAALAFRSSTATWDHYGSGWRFSFDQDANNTANNDQLRGHGIPAGRAETNLDDPAHYAAAFPSAANVAYDLALQWRSGTNTLTWTLARADGTGTPVVVPVTDSSIAGLMGAYLGVNVSAGRKVRLENPTLTDDGAGGGGPPPPPPGEAWRDDTTQWAQILPLSQVSAGSIVHINSNADLAQLNPGTPGKHYVIGGNLTGNVTVTGAGTKAAPIVIRGDYDGTDRTQFRKWTYSGNTNLTISGGASHVYVTKICWVGSSNTSQNVKVGGTATRVSIERCWSYGQSSGGLYDTAAYGTDATANVRFFRLRYCEHGNPNVKTAAGMWTMGNPAGVGATVFPQFMYFYRNLVSNVDDSGVTTTFGAVLLSIGRGEASSDMDNKAAFYENRLRDIGAVGECMEMKSTNVVLAYNTCESSPHLIALRIRQGHNGSIIGNLFVDSPTNAGAGTIEARGYDHVVINNWAVQLAAGAQVAAGSPNGTSDVNLWGGNVDALSFPASKADQANTPRPNAIRNQAGGNRMPVTVGANNGEGGLKLGACLNVVGPGAGGSSVPYRNRSWSIDPADGDRDYAGRGQTKASYKGSPAYGTAIGGSTTVNNKAITGADYDKVPVRLFDSDVGIACKVYP